MLFKFLEDEKVRKQLYPYNYPKGKETYDPGSVPDQIGYLMMEHDAWVIKEYGIRTKPETCSKKSIYWGFQPYEGFEGTFDFEKYRMALEQEFKEVGPEEYAEAYHAKVLKMIPRMLFEMRALVLKRMGRELGIDEKYTTITKPAEITEEMKRLEELMLDSGEMEVLRAKIVQTRELWGEGGDAAEVFYDFKVHEVLEGVKEELGTTVDAEFYNKAIKITERIKNARIRQITDYLQTMEG